jgi:hypothetical protein
VAALVGLSEPDLRVWHDQGTPAVLKPDSDGRHVGGPALVRIGDGATRRLHLQLTRTGDGAIEAHLLVDGKVVDEGLTIPDADGFAFDHVRFAADDQQPTLLLDNIEIRFAPAAVWGDFNGDGQMTRIDREAMVLALDDAEAYRAAYPDVSLIAVGDFNADGRFDGNDVALFDEILRQQM